MASERPKLPPGWYWHEDGLPHMVDGGYMDDADGAWSIWSENSDVTRERWEAMERAVEFVAEFRDRYECGDLDHFRALEGWAEEILKAALDGGDGASGG